ncbi:siroheme synthase CysG [Candidatus Purcelliella pentastirinorum]|nr:siroheme synthase CysG [Candidatus Purcelliella pentastirinorum]
MKYLPLFVDLKLKPILVIGGGSVAVRKIKLFCSVGAIVYVVANKLCDDLKKIYNENKIKWLSKKFNINQLNNIFLVIVATNNNNLNEKIYKEANNKFIFVNVVDNLKKCSFIFPSIINRSPLLISISSSGMAPMLVRLLKEKLETILPKSLSNIVNIAGKFRDKVKKYLIKSDDRKRFWENFFNSIFSSYVSCNNFKLAYKVLNNHLKYKNKLSGEIILVGAGPGDSGLLTLRALQAIQRADIVLYDYLVSKQVLNLIRKDAKLICVGKRYGYHFYSQKKINNLLILYAKKGKCVIRLKGGDPFIFGRGGEELLYAYKYGIPFQVIPGITSGIAAPTYAGIPLTHRDYSHGVIFINGYNYKNCINSLKFNYSSFTLVIYMFSINIKYIYKQLILNGCSKNIKVAIISLGTHDEQYVKTGILSELNILIKDSFSPRILIIGKVVELRKKLSWFKISKNHFNNKNYILNLL